MKKTAIVIGATGLIGKTLVDQLAEAAHIGKVITLTRRTSDHPSPKVVNRVVDFDRLEEHASSFNADILFSCLGTTRSQAGSIEAQRRVDLDYQFEAAQLAASQGVGHYLLVSSSGANAQSKRPYLNMKGMLEQRVKSLAFGRITIFQPSLLSGHRTDVRPGEKLAGWVLPILCLLPGLKRFRPITGEQVAAKMVQASQQAGPQLEWFRLDEIFIEA